MKILILIGILLTFLLANSYAQFIGIRVGIPSISVSGVGGGGNNKTKNMTFNGKYMLFNGAYMTFTHS